MKKEFIIDKPEIESSIFIMILKYLTLSIVTILGVFFLLPLFFRPIFRLLENNSITISLYLILVIMITLYIYFRYFLRKMKLTKIFNIIIDYDINSINFKSVNNYSGKVLEKTIKISDLKIEVNLNNHPLFGKQRELLFFENNSLFNTINIDMTAWNRYDKINDMIETVLELDKGLKEHYEKM